MPKAIDEDRDPVLRVGDLLDVVAQVRAHHARVDDVERASERLPDVARRLRRRRGGHPEQRRFAQRLETAPDEEVVGAEVVAPHAHAVHLVHDDETDADVGQEIDEARLPQALGRRVDEALVSGGHAGESRGRLLRRERGVDERRGRRDLRRELVDLVLHERDQRREDERRLGAQHRGELVRERLARAGRHERERVAACDRGAHDVLLPGPEGVEAEELAQRGEEIGQAREYRRRLGRPCARLRNNIRSSGRRAGEVVVSREAVLGHDVPVAAWWVYEWPAMRSPVGSVERARLRC